MTPSQAQDYIDEVREAQRIVVLQLSGWLRGRSGAALERLKDARAREAALFKIVLTVERQPGFQPGHGGHRKDFPDSCTIYSLPAEGDA